MKKSEAAKEYLKTVHVPLIDTENVEAMLYNMRMMAFSAGHDAGVRYAIEQADNLVGYACTEMSPLTSGATAYDLYVELKKLMEPIHPPKQRSRA